MAWLALPDGIDRAWFISVGYSAKDAASSVNTVSITWRLLSTKPFQQHANLPHDLIRGVADQIFTRIRHHDVFSRW